ncbi:geranylgeranyl transferase type-2 subunit beta [Trichoderma harzianum]|uniref:Geranylgeranyl transferase type-2 subunit beta n=1 Tax=Trichoderma harzianum TaxID=5544 RepID=A0A0F9Y654_TRIHA|nr:geranylgeranyl transferase type-2 subunit beta [Trichoderma harzianum]
MAEPTGNSEGPKLATDAHVKYVLSLDTKTDELDYWMTEHLRLNGAYWGLSALHFLSRPEALPRKDTIDFVLSCQHENGGFGAAPGHDAHLLSTVSAVQILAMVDGFDELEARGKGKAVVGKFLADLQNPESGSFFGDEWGEEDTRFLYAALNALSLLGLLSLVDVDKAVAHVVSCTNFDGGYGAKPGAESHAAQVFTCVAALAIAGRLDLVEHEKLGRWLSERQLPGGGLNGRPEKQEDVCYSWWVLSSLAIIDRVHWIEKQALINFILNCQDPDNGGFSDRPGNQVDVWHTCFGAAGLSLLGYPGMEPVDPRYCMPKKIVARVLGE